VEREHTHRDGGDGEGRVGLGGVVVNEEVRDVKVAVAVAARAAVQLHLDAQVVGADDLECDSSAM
jgi:hypothetical protein